MRGDAVVFAVADALGCKFCSALDRFVKIVAVQVHACDDRAENIAGSAAVAANAVYHHDTRFFASAVHVVHDLLSVVGDAGHHDVFRALFRQDVAHFRKFGVAKAFVAVFHVGQCAKFGQVRRQDVGVADEFFHLFAHLGRVGFVESAVVAHYRVHQGKRVVLLEFLEEIRNDVDLFCGSQEPRCDGVELHSQIFIGLDVVAHFRGVIVEEVFRELRVRRKNRSRYRDRLDFHRRNDRCHDGYRATAKSCNIVD